MKTYHYYFFVLKFIILIAILLSKFGVIPINGKYHIIVDSLFKISLGIFIIIYFLNNNLNIDNHDRLLFFVSGVILITMVNYNELYEAIKSDYKFKK
jgi:hypothetical protein